MDSLITYDEAAEFLKNPPSLSPRLDFTKMRALRKHMVKALKQLLCPQSAVHGWTGMVLSQWCTRYLNQPLSQYQEILARWQYTINLPPLQ